MDNQKHSHLLHSKLKSFLQKKHELSSSEKAQYKFSIDHCKECWQRWNVVRWDAAMQSKGVQELQLFLGEKFIPYYDSSWALANDWYQRNPQTQEEIEDFYRTTAHYIYNSLIFYESGDRDDLTGEMTYIFNTYAPKTVLDYGCGVGSDGLEMLELGAMVFFADYNIPDLNFLRWRLAHRGYVQDRDYQVIQMQSNTTVPSAELVWCVDVLEHMVHPLSILEAFTEETKVFAFFTDTDDKAGGRHPFHISYDLSELLKRLKKLGFSLQHEKSLQVWARE
jgi:2-polyprenyl-3-methyl-5-hydroxy-6-metoxy-1,4-benzoquinol methylase